MPPRFNETFGEQREEWPADKGHKDSSSIAQKDTHVNMSHYFSENFVGHIPHRFQSQSNRLSHGRQTNFEDQARAYHQQNESMNFGKELLNQIRSNFYFSDDDGFNNYEDTW